MEFIFKTDYTAKSMAVIAKALRKTIRKKHSRRTRIFGVIIFLIGLFFSWVDGFTFDLASIITYLAMVTVALTIIFEDKINGYVAKKKMLPGTENSEVTFNDDGFCSVTPMASSNWNYDKISLIVETKDYFVFIFSLNHAQLYDKNNLTGGTVDEFRNFIEEKTEKKIILIK